MRRFRSISNYLSLGAENTRSKLCAPHHPPGWVPSPGFVPPGVVTVVLLRSTIAQLAADGVPPISNIRHPIGYIDSDGAHCIVKLGADIPAGCEVLWHEPRPGSEDFGPYYEVSLPAEDMTALLGDPGSRQPGLRASSASSTRASSSCDRRPCA